MGYLALIIALLLSGFSGPSIFIVNAAIAFSGVLVAISMFILVIRLLPFKLKPVEGKGRLIGHALYWGVIIVLIAFAVWVGDNARDFFARLLFTLPV